MVKTTRSKWVGVVGLVLASMLIVLAVGPVALAQDSPPLRKIVKFQGVVESRPEDTDVGEWVIAGETVQVTEDTQINEEAGPAVVGARVVVVAQQQEDETLTAIFIRVVDPEQFPVITIKGVVTEVGPDYLVVNGLTVQLTEDTEIEGDLEVGAFVTVRAQADFSETPPALVALSVTVMEPHFPRRMVAFDGELENIDDTNPERAIWTIDGRDVIVTPKTIIEGEPQVGDEVQVKALVMADDTLVAVHIRVKSEMPPQPEPVSFSGEIQHFPRRMMGRWIIGGQAVEVTPMTQINGTPAVGLNADVEAVRWQGALMALSIDIETPAGTPEPPSTPVWPPMPTAMPTGMPTMPPMPTPHPTWPPHPGHGR